MIMRVWSLIASLTLFQSTEKPGYSKAICTGQLHAGRVAVIAGIKNNHFLTGTDTGLNGAKNCKGGPGGNGNFTDRVKAELVTLLVQICHQTTEHGQAIAWRILIKSPASRTTKRIQQLGRSREIRKALGQVDGTQFLRQIRHGAKNSDAQIGKFGR